MSTDTRPSGGKRALSIVIWVVQVLLAAFFVFASLPKLLGDPTTVQMFGIIGLGDWFRYLTGICELAGAIGLLIPRLSALAAAGLSATMVFATLTNLFVLPGAALIAIQTIVLAVIFAAIAWYRWDQTKRLIALLRRRTSGDANGAVAT